MREKILKTLAGFHARRPWWMLAIIAGLTIIFGYFAAHFKVTMRWSDLLPSEDRRTIQFNKIIDEFVSATSIILVVEGQEERIKSFAEEVVPEIRLLVDSKDDTPFIKRIDYKLEIDFLKQHGLMLIKEDDLKNMKDVYKNPNLVPLVTNINNSLEKEYVGREESLSTREKEDQAFTFLDGLENFITSMKLYVVDMPEESSARNPQNAALQAVDRLLLGEPYILSYDRTTLIVNVIPNFTMWDAGKMVDGVDAVQEVVDKALLDNPDIRAGLTGILPVGHEEMVYGEKSIGYTTFIALIAVFFLLVVSFRMWIAPVLALSNLIVGIVWAVGAAMLLVGTLNVMTYMMTVILVGLGIDFSIHMISGFTEGRSLGKPVEVAMEETFLKNGKGILTGGLTTSIAFLTLNISSSRGMKELGIVTGIGLIAILIATFLFLPSLLVFRERRFEKKRKQGKLRKEFALKDISFKSLGRIGRVLSERYITTLIASVLVTAFLIFSSTQISFDQNYMNMEPRGLPSVTLQDTVLDKFDMSMDYALILAQSVEESRAMAEKAKDLGIVAVAEDISVYFPSNEQQKQRMPFINEIRDAVRDSPVEESFEEEDFEKFRKELNRLEMNIMEIQDMAYLGGQDRVDNKCVQIIGKPDDSESKNLIREFIEMLESDRVRAMAGLSKFQEEFSPYFQKSVVGMSSVEPIHLESLPQTILDRYTNKGRTEFLITIFPSDNIWQDAEFLKSFVNNLERVNENVTGMPSVFRALIEIIGRDGRNAILLALVVVFLVLWMDYRKPGHALMAMIPLTIGFFWMLGFMGITGIKLTVMSVMGLPMIIGIGVDDGVHIVHRWRIEGKGRIIQVFASTGKAILLTSATTMLAFGSLVFSIWPGFASLGLAMFIGVGACFLATVIILSGILGLLERKK
ncbi:MAG: MMPL family transporter [Candidatus Aminicenantes bacterium]|nr:MAG: MMPL family transporter [Candidatus Aminicenantes bacterium]